MPTAESSAFHQRAVSNLSVRSNAPGVATGDGLGGNLEFWSTNYGPANAAGVPGAGSDFDNGDVPAETGTYGSMQVHLDGAGRTLFALNAWNRGADADLGIGTREPSGPGAAGQSRDWTFAKNASDFPIRKLTVLVRPTSR